MWPDVSFILLQFCDISCLFCEISSLCSRVVCKYVVSNVVTVSSRVSTSVKRSLFVIVAEPYRPVELILIYICYNSVYYFFILNSNLIFCSNLATMLLTEGFWGWVFLGSVQHWLTLIRYTDRQKGLRWLSRCELIRLRRISFATLSRYGWMGGLRNGY